MLESFGKQESQGILIHKIRWLTTHNNRKFNFKSSYSAVPQALLKNDG